VVKLPVKITKKNHKFQVRTPGGVKSKGTSKKKAESQARLLRAIEHDPSFKPSGRGVKRKK
jgi:hypothetical protein